MKGEKRAQLCAARCGDTHRYKHDSTPKISIHPIWKQVFSRIIRILFKNFTRQQPHAPVVGFPKLSPLVREISWTNNLIIVSRAKAIEEKEFYLQLCMREKYSSRELERQINTSVFERSMLGKTKLSAVMREMHPDVANSLKDSYVFEFLHLPEPHSESSLQNRAIEFLSGSLGSRCEKAE